METKRFGMLDVKIFPNREMMGKASAEDASECIRTLLSQKEEINCIFAAAPSQNDFLSALVGDERIPWSRINAYHMDEYVGLKQGGKASFSRYLIDAVFGKVSFKSVHLFDGQADPEKETARYARLLSANKPDVVFMGIGENGHIAFNDPGVADFNDKFLVKMVEIDEICRMQQVHDGCFPSLDEVPRRAFTVTVPGLMMADYKFCVVPTKLKAPAVRRMLLGPVSTDCPASILRTSKNSILYLDSDSAGLLE